MRFVVDCMLGKLAKWLKILGFDTVYFPRAEDDLLIQIARRERRILLSRDLKLLARADKSRSLYVASEAWREQVRQVIQAFELESRIKPFSRCLHCNHALRRLSRQNARNLVSSFVFEKAKRFAFCPRCGRVFWQGTHFEDMEAQLAAIFGFQEGEMG